MVRIVIRVPFVDFPILGTGVWANSHVDLRLLRSGRIGLRVGLDGTRVNLNLPTEFFSLSWELNHGLNYKTNTNPQGSYLDLESPEMPVMPLHTPLSLDS